MRGELLQLGVTIPASRKQDSCEVLGKNGGSEEIWGNLMNEIKEKFQSSNQAKKYD